MTTSHSRPRSWRHLPPHSTVCVDANVLAYHFIQIDELTTASTALLERGLRKEIHLVTTPQLVSDVIHRMMLYEARLALPISTNQRRN